MKRIDAHAHIFPTPIAMKASANIGSFYEIPMHFDGTIETLLQIGDRNQIDQFIVQSVATLPGQVENINTFISSQVAAHPDRLIGFATMHPQYPRIAQEIERAIGLGLRGVKLHPDFQKFMLDDPEAYPIYECIEGRLPLLVHTGDHRYQFSKPERMAKVLDRFPKLQVICAHFGGWSEWDHGAEVLAGRPGVWVDTSSSLYAMSPEHARMLIDRFGVDQVLFGTDYPMWDAADELKLISRIGLSEEEEEKIFHKNAERLLGLEE